MYRKTNIIIIVVISIFVFSCNNDETNIKDVTNKIDSTKADNNKIDTLENIITDFEKILIDAGLVDIEKLDATILLDIRYSTTNNFLKIDMYGDYEKAYFREEVANRIVDAQKLLKNQNPSYSLIIFDGTRPRTIQKLMWDSIKIPENQKFKYLANPKNTSMHSYGLAVDLSIADSNGVEIDMGTEFDSFKELAYPVLEERMLKNGSLTQHQYENRKLLRSIMKEAGFNSITTEWWHFSIYSREEATSLFSAVKSHVLPSDTLSYIAEIVEEVQEVETTELNIRFKIQIKTSSQILDLSSNIFMKLPIFRYYHDGMYKYTTGSFNDLESAYNHRDKIKAMGFDDCFVAGFNNDERIGIKEAVELAN